ncbi:hypothetical protein H8D36_04235 [archaeon]|nr:hypothetical protein [archaeon]MBL7056943.1 hypothetical protein [Candidatus Woesearchaeota archaeon]
MSNTGVTIREYKIPVKILGEKHEVSTLIYEKKGSSDIGAFANGFCIAPSSYSGLLENVVDQANIGIMISPAISGVRIANNHSEQYINNSHQSTVKLFQAVIEAYRSMFTQVKEEIVGSDSTAEIAHSIPVQSNGHSHGGSYSQVSGGHSITQSSQGKAILINPIMPVGYGRLSFATRGMELASRQLMYGGLPSWKARLGKHGVEWNLNFFGNLENNVLLLKSLCAQSINDLYPLNENTDALLITSQATQGRHKGGDEYFNFDKWVPELEERFNSLSRVRIPEDTGDQVAGEFSHEMVIMRPELFVPHIVKFLTN